MSKAQISIIDLQQGVLSDPTVLVVSVTRGNRIDHTNKTYWAGGWRIENGRNTPAFVERRYQRAIRMQRRLMTPLPVSEPTRLTFADEVDYGGGGDGQELESIF